ncbi:MAG: transglutaminase domain-containing protein [Clostridiales bacterium]|nr:transglutaminase domain-containing protein [Clostridiales bacterium]
MRRRIETIRAVKTSPGPMTYLLSTLLSTFLSVGFTCMLTSTYELEIETSFFIVVIALLSLLATFIHIKTEKIRWLSPVLILATPLLIALLVYMDMMDTASGFEHVMYNLKRYSFRNLDMDFERQKNVEFALTMLMVMMNLFPVMVTTWVITRRKNVIFSLLTYVPFFICSVALNYMFPGQVWCEMALFGVILLCLFQNAKRSDRRTSEKRLLCMMVPALILVMLVGVVFPKKTYDKQELAAKQMSTIRSIITKTSQSKTVQDIAQGVTKLPGSNEFVEKSTKSYMGSVIMESVASGVAAANTRSENLLMAGNFDPPNFAVMSVRRTENRYALPVSSSPYLYLKSTSMDEYAGQSWNVSYYEPDYDKVYLTGSHKLWGAEADYIVRINCRLTADINYIPLYMDGYGVSSDISSRINVTDYYNVKMQVPATGAWEYSYAVSDLPVERYPDLWTPQYLNYVTDDCLELPKETVDAILDSGMLPEWFIKQMNGELDMSEYEIVRAVTDYVSRLHPYDSHTEFPPENKDFVVWFMTEAKSGFCVHYASTAVVLLRMLGVPARYCTGYMVDNIQGDNLTEVYSTDAHAWFEFFDLKYGWIMGDATPGNATAAGYFDVNALMEKQGIEKKEIPDHKSSDQNGTAALTTPTPVVTQDPDGATSTPRPTKDASDTNKEEDKGAGSTDDGSGGLSGLFSSLTARIISAVLILLLLLIALRLIYTRLWRRAMNDENINKRARAYYRYFAMMSGKWKGRPSSHASFIAQKAAFSAGGISEDELELLVRSGKNGLLGIKNKQPWYRRVPVSLLWEVKI